MSAKGLLLCASLVAIGRPAAAERQAQAVALVNLAPPGRRTSAILDRLRSDLATHGTRSLPPGALRDAFEEPQAPAGGAVTRAADLLAEARNAYADFDYRSALDRLSALDRELVSLSPSPPAVDLLAARQLLAGVILEGDGRSAAARDAFRSARALDPTRAMLDPAIYPPQVVAAYAAAIGERGRRAELVAADLPAGATLYVDGRAVTGPLVTDEGLHWVVVTAPGHAATGAVLRVKPGKAPLELEARRLSPALRAAELRAGLLGRADDSAALRAAAAELARLAEVELLVLVRDGKAGVQAAQYDAVHGALGPWGPPDATRLTPPPPAAVELGGERAAEDRAWHQAWWGRSLLVGGGALVAGAIVYAVVASREEDVAPGLTIGGWCFENQACP